MNLDFPEPSSREKDGAASMQQRSPSRESNAPVTHIIGAGLAGLAAAVRLAEQGRQVAVYEAAGQAGGRCRSYFDAGFGAVIDNGNRRDLKNFVSQISMLPSVRSTSFSLRRTISPSRSPAQ